MASKTMQTREEIEKLYTDTYRTRMPLYNDYVFHRIYGSDTEESHTALIGLLNIILNRKDDPIRSIEIKNTVDYGERPEEKDTTMDIKAETDAGELLTIEMHVGHLAAYRNRALFYYAGNIACDISGITRKSTAKNRIGAADFLTAAGL